jgi:hypothetical protein
VLLSTGLVAVSAFSHEWAHDGLARPGSLPLVTVAVWLDLRVQAQGRPGH